MLLFIREKKMKEKHKMSKRISILGSTGSIGRQSLEVIAACGMTAAALTAHSLSLIHI